MEAITINGKEIKTNINAMAKGFPMLKESMMNAIPVPAGKTVEDFLNEMVEQGCTRITFYEVSTCIRGYHHIYANCR